MSKGAKVMFGEMYGYFMDLYTCIKDSRRILIFASFKFARFNFAHLVETHSLSFKFARVIFRVPSFYNNNNNNI
jgi:hypothetical protein